MPSTGLLQQRPGSAKEPPAECTGASRRAPCQRQSASAWLSQDRALMGRIREGTRALGLGPWVLGRRLPRGPVDLWKAPQGRLEAAQGPLERRPGRCCAECHQMLGQRGWRAPRPSAGPPARRLSTLPEGPASSRRYGTCMRWQLLWGKALDGLGEVPDRG